MDSDDDLPPPPPKQQVILDDSDDDLPPPPPRAPAAAKTIVNLDDDDDDLPPPPPKAPVAAAPPPAVAPPSAATKSVASDDSPSSPSKAKSEAPPTSAAPPVPAAPSPVAAASPEPESTRPRSSVTIVTSPDQSPSSKPPVATRARSGTVAKQKIYKEGYLLKQQPQWPYTLQKRWCVVQNRVLTYYESKENASKPSGSLDLKDAQFKTTDLGTDKPFCFGIQVAVDPHAGATGLGLFGSKGGDKDKSRTYVFAGLNKDEFEDWTNVLQAVCAQQRPQAELHWFEKMAQGIF